jgi:hypothetical protein
MGMMRRIWGAVAPLAVVAAFGICSQAQAGLIPTNVTITPDGGNFRWTYAVVVTTDVHVQTGDFFTIYDFGGLVMGPGNTLSNVVTPAGWAVSSNLTGTTPPGTTPGDNGSVPNLTFTYTGPTITGQVGLGNFWAISTFNNSASADFTSLTQTNVGGRTEANITTTSVPVPGNVNKTPEPATWAMFGLGLPVCGVGGWLRRRLRRQA